MEDTFKSLSLKTYTSTEKKFLVYFFISDFWLHTPIWILFFASKGYSLLDIAFINMFFWWSIVLFEIPTGYVADLFGRKISIVLSYLIQSFGIALFVVSKNEIVLIISSIIWGLGITLSSGADTAWLYDEIQYSEMIIQGRTKNQANGRYRNVYGSAQSLSYFSLAISQVLGGFIAEINLSLPHTIVAILFFFVSFYVILIPEHRSINEPQKDLTEQESSTYVKKPSVKIAFKEFITPLVFVFSIIPIILGSFLDIRYFMQEDLANSALSYGSIGIYFGLVMLVISFGNAQSKFIIKMFLKTNSYIILLLTIGTSFILMSIAPLVQLLIIFLLVNFSYGVLSPVLSENINRMISSENRATILSIISLCTKLVFIMFQITISYIIITYGFKYAYLVTGVAIVIILVPCTLYIKSKRVAILVN